jgi:mannose/fructose/N-acetylgalactosamine-specific phosphotransferase system component IIC
VAGTTTGFGDIVPVSGYARIISSLQIVFSYCFLGYVIARLTKFVG